MDGLNWVWIACALTVPVVLGVLSAGPFWAKQQMIFGNVVATCVIFGAAVALILREYVELDRLEQACIDAGTLCWPEPSAFTRFAIYAGIGLAQIFAVFSLSLVVEQRLRRRHYAPEWR